MKAFKTYKFKLNPTKSQVDKFEAWINTCRYIYNVALEERITAYRTIKKSISRYEQYNQLPEIKKDFPFVSDIYSDTLQEVLDRVDKSYKNFFLGSGFPKFSKKGNYRSFTYKRHFSVCNTHIKLPKIGSVKYFNSRPMSGNLKTATILKEGNSYFICIVSELPDKPVTIDDSQAVGIDMGIVNFAFLSDGRVINNPLFLHPRLRQLRVLQRKLSRQKRGSVSRDKTKKKISALHFKILNCRMDYLHKVSTTIANEYSSCYMEDLKIKNMLGLRSIALKLSDSSFGLFKEQLQYKFKERGKHLGLVHPAYTSQTCSECFSVDKNSRLSQSEFVCTGCGHLENADLNASKNIMRQGMSQGTKRKALA